MRNGFFGALIIFVATAGVGLSDEARKSGPAPALGGPVTSNSQAPALPPDGAATVGRENGRFWGSAEFLLWWIRDGNVPPLATAGPLTSGGVLGAPGTRTLFGDNLDYGERSGARFAIGSWLNCDGTKGIELSYFFLDGGGDGFGASSFGASSLLVARPFFNVITGLPGVQLVAVPGVVTGGIRISSDSDFNGAEANLLCNLCCLKNSCPTACTTSGYRVDLILGPRYLGLEEDLGISERLTFLPAAPAPFVPGSTITVVDQFETRSRFYGGQIGARAEWWRGRGFVNVLGKVALGATHQEVRISGTTVITVPGAAPSVQPGGLLALPTNIGDYSRDTFTVAPEIGVNLGYQVTKHVRAFVGYSFLYWSSVVRPGDQIDFGVNPTQLPFAGGPGGLVGPPRPAFAFRDSDFWAHGINVGVELRW